MARNDSVTFKIKGLPPSSNHAIVQGKNGRRYPSKEYRDWKNRVKQQPIKKIIDSDWYGVEIILRFPIRYANGNVRNKDTSNFLKYAEDELIKKLVTYSGETIDDRLDVECYICKVNDKNESVEITFYATGEIRK